MHKSGVCEHAAVNEVKAAGWRYRINMGNYTGLLWRTLIDLPKEMRLEHPKETRQVTGYHLKPVRALAL